MCYNYFKAFLLLYSLLQQQWLCDCTSQTHPTARGYMKRSTGLTIGRDADESDDDNDDDPREDLNNNRLHWTGKNLVASRIASAFFNRKTFACPRSKPVLHTGTSTADLSPEDIDIVAALGDSLAAGRGLWPGTDIEFRGAAFPIGGDATIDGLVTIPNILLEFNERVLGVSHGMGTRQELPDDQLNCAASGAKSSDMPEQAKELIRRIHAHHGRNSLNNQWIMLIITIGTEELCYECSLPNYNALRGTMKLLSRWLPKIFVVLLGPVHVSFSHSLTSNLLRGRCKCLRDLSKSQFRELLQRWAETFYRLQDELNSPQKPTFGLLAIPSLTIASRQPDGLFIDDKPLLNRKGHAYAAKWLWNRLVTGPEYNLSDAILSEDAYFCPSVGCPYFRTVANRHSCDVITEKEWQASLSTEQPSSSNSTKSTKRREVLKQHLILVVTTIVVLAFISVTVFGTIFYRRGLKNSTLRFDAAPGV